MPQANLDAIRKKVRRLTRSPAESQIQTSELDDYINTFVVYDVPQHIQLMHQRSTATIFTQPLEDRYNSFELPDGTTANTIKNAFISTHNPVYINGDPAHVTQSRAEFYSLYPLNQQLKDTQQRGDGVTTDFTGTITPNPFLVRYVTISSKHTVSINGVNTKEALIAYDNPDQPQELVGDVGPGNNRVNHNNGTFDVTFSTPPDQGEPIYVAVTPVKPTRPDSIMFFEDMVFVRPVPDKAYRIEFEVMLRPTDLLLQTDEPNIRQWWQYIAFGAAKKIFEDRMDMESVALIQPELDRQERMVLRNTLTQLSKERAKTIYTGAYDHPGSGFFNDRW